jgi:hypothetical protein
MFGWTLIATEVFFCKNKFFYSQIVKDRISKTTLTYPYLPVKNDFVKSL